ncbi:hypothetical protein [Mesorhizobium sp. M1088]|uniref:hypothetical protein n=1 Tax=Mesorhizobium sp. M1088 TaxID=2957056 RepID=UPI00333565DF
MRPGRVAVRPAIEKTKYMPTPTMTAGAIIGTSSKAEIVRRPGRLGAARPSAAMVPSGVAKSVVETARTRLLRRASIQVCIEKNSRYHFSDQPVMGKVKSPLLLNENSTMMISGAMRKASTIMAVSPRPKRPSRLVVVDRGEDIRAS